MIPPFLAGMMARIPQAGASISRRNLFRAADEVREVDQSIVVARYVGFQVIGDPRPDRPHEPLNLEDFLHDPFLFDDDLELDRLSCTFDAFLSEFSGGEQRPGIATGIALAACSICLAVFIAR